jgi:hypothetical protein
MDMGTTAQWAGAGLGGLSLLWNVVLTIGQRGKATSEAILRVETRAVTWLQEHESRLTKQEEVVRHALTKADLNELYTVARKTEADVAGIKSTLRALEGGQRDITNLILQRGINQ